MKKIFTPIVVSLVLMSSCTTLYKSGQTPDDVYYSPIRLYNEDDDKDRDDKRNNRNQDVADINERQIRMGINNPRWRNFDNDFSYNPWLFGFNTGYYYNPLYCPLPVYNPFVPTTPSPNISTLRTTNLNAYNSNNYVNANAPVNPKTGIRTTSPTRNYNQGSSLGNTIRRLFDNSNNSNGSYNNNNSNRSYSPSSSSSGSNSRSSSGGSGVSRPARSGRN
jgi:hypothetical protein